MSAVKIQVNVICPTSTQAWIANGATLVDVRESWEVENLSFDAPQVINIPISEFEERYPELSQDQKLVLVCHDGDRALRATAYLISKGYNGDNVVAMKHGMVRWVQKGFAVKGDTSQITDSHGCCGGGGCCN